MHSPFKFLDSYTREDKEVFFGRKTEIEELYTRIYQSNLLLVYGPSGTGKTSLIQCGLGNKFQESDWLPLYIRRGSNINLSIKTNISSVSVTKIQSDTKLFKQINSLFLDHFKPIYLIFDQFEELFIFGSEEEKRQFIHEIAALVQSNLQCKLLFVIREEYLAHLTEFEYILPQLFENRLRVEKMNRTKAEEVITGPCQVAGIEVEEGFAKNLLEKLSPEKSDIELTYLQVFLDKLYKLNAKQFTNNILEQVGRVGDVLASFLEEQVSHIPDSESALNVLKAFVSVEGTKKQMSYSEIREFTLSIGKNIPEEKIEALVHQFVDLRILRDKDEQGKYELRHDALAAKIYEKITVVEKEMMEVKVFLENRYSEHIKRKTYLNQNDVNYIEPYSNNIFVNDFVKIFYFECKQRLLKQNRWKKISIAAFVFIFLLMLTAVSGLIYSINLKNKIIVISHSNAIATKAYRILEKDPTLAFRLAEQAYKIAPEPLAKEVLMASYGEMPFYQVLRGHRESVSIAKYSPDGKWIATASSDGLIKIWDNSGNFKLDLKGHKGSFPVGVSDVINFSPNSRYLVSAPYDSTARLWDIITGKCIAILNHKGIVSSVVFSPNGNNILTASEDKTAKLWDLNGKELIVFKHNKGISACLFSSKGQKIYTASGDSTIKIWTISGNLIKTLSHPDNVCKIIVSRNDSIIVSGANDMKIRIWKMASSGKWFLFKTLEFLTGQIKTLTFSNDNNHFGVSSNDKIFVCTVKKDKEVISISGFNSIIYSSLFSNDGKQILVSAGDGVPYLWNINKESRLNMELRGHTDLVYAANFSPDGNYVVTASGDKTARIWNIKPKVLPPSNYDSLLTQGIIILPDSVNMWLSRINKEKVRGEVMELSEEELKIFGIE